jgi:hypothetical protein
MRIVFSFDSWKFKFSNTYGILIATYGEYVLFHDPGNCSVLGSSFEKHEAVSQ